MKMSADLEYIDKKELKAKFAEKLMSEINNKKKLLQRKELMDKNIERGSKKWSKLKLKSEYLELDIEAKQRILNNYNMIFLEKLWILIEKKELTSKNIINDKFNYKDYDNFYEEFKCNLQITI